MAYEFDPAPVRDEMERALCNWSALRLIEALAENEEYLRRKKFLPKMYPEGYAPTEDTIDTDLFSCWQEYYIEQFEEGCLTRIDMVEALLSHAETIKTAWRHEVYVCPYGCHTVELSQEENDE